MSYTLDGRQASKYGNVGQRNDFTVMSGQIVLPVATDDPDEDSVVVVRAHKDFRIRTVSYTARKDGCPPVFPKPGDVGGFAFLGGAVSVPYPALTASAGFTWEVSTEYIFVETGPVNPETDGYVLGSLPWVYAGQLDNAQYGSYVGSTAPDSVSEAGLGPKAGYALGQQLNTNSNWTYAEPSFLPASVQSSDLINGPSSYPTLGSA